MTITNSIVLVYIQSPYVLTVGQEMCSQSHVPLTVRRRSNINGGQAASEE
ncbi:hypothetical protein EXN66_Car001068 [Channa argus]|uniref:Uncharacterized protein n=1 Tax=Channa argus TaxID=215402 RepID=A0A6G1QZD9_CHAAH|nr:hypothetical protein EXN66_Car001068 [Channa argus]